MTLEIRMSSESFGRGAGHYGPTYEGGATVADALAAGAKYAAAFHYNEHDIVYEPWKDWTLLLKNKGKPYTSVKVTKVSDNITNLAYDNPPNTGKVPGYYGDERYEIDMGSMPRDMKLQDIFDFAELAHQGGRTWCKDCAGPFRLDGKKIVHHPNKPDTPW